MRKKRILIVVHNERMLHKLIEIVQKAEGNSEIISANNINDAYTYMMNWQVDLFLIDVVLDCKEVNDTSGLRLVQGIRNIKRYAFTPIIILSCLEGVALYAYRDLHCYGVLEKPFDMEYVTKMIKDALGFSDSLISEEKIYFKNQGVIFSVNKDEIVYAESNNHIIYVYMSDERQFQIRYKTIKRFLEELDSPELFQCSRSGVVNRKYIENIDFVNGVIRLIENYGKLDIGMTFRERIKAMFKEKMIW